jgi:DsbC/DsbD-like thiol-disulfide interchange protein
LLAVGRRARLNGGMKPVVCALAAVVFSAATPAVADGYASDWAHASKADARLVAGPPGQAAVEVRLAPGAITYWRNPGDSGAPPRFDFAGSRNLGHAEPSFPAPKRITEPDGSDAFGYDDAVVFPIAVAPIDASQPVMLKLKFDYAVCEKLCLPAKADLALTLAQTGSSPYAALIAAAAAKVPRPGDLGALGGELQATAADAWRLCVPAEPGPSRDLFVEAPEGWWFAAKPEAEANGRACFTLNLQQKPDGAALPVTVRATLTGGATAHEFPLALAAKL